MLLPIHIATFDPALMIGKGFTVILNDCTAPGQVAAVGVTETTAVVVTVLVLTAVNAAMLPEPDAPRPMVVLLLVHV